MSAAPLSWIKDIQSTLIDLGKIPLSGNAPEFPWEGFSQKIAELLQVPELKISARKTALLNGADAIKGFGAGFLSIALDLTPLNDQAFWVMGKEEVAKLTALALSGSGGKGFSSPKFQEGFYYYLATEAIQAVNGLNALGDLALKMAKPASPPHEESLCIDVELHLPKQTLWGRLICPAALHASFKSHFYDQKPPSLTSAIAKQTDVNVHIELGQTQLLLSEWQKIKVGDFILLERCGFDPTTHKGTATLMLGRTPLLRTRIKDNSLKIIDYALYREEQLSMSAYNPPDDEKTGEEDEISSAEFETEESTEAGHLWSAGDGDTEKLISPQDIPLTLSVEVARMRINLEKLLQLSPGNVLELPVRPEHGVDVVIDGKKVAKAELIKLGEMLGIKILQLAD